MNLTRVRWHDRVDDYPTRPDCVGTVHQGRLITIRDWQQAGDRLDITILSEEVPIEKNIVDSSTGEEYTHQMYRQAPTEAAEYLRFCDYMETFCR